MWFMFEKIASLKECTWRPGVFITGESITNTNNSTNIRKKIEIVPGRTYWDRKKLFLDTNFPGLFLET
jgi:hypothetical protein